jgi:plastocyanin
MRNQRKRHVAAAAAFTVALGGAAIGGAAIGRAQVAVPTVTVTLKEFKLTPAKTSTAAGRVTFVVVNAGKLPHVLAVTGPGLKTTKTGMLAPGKTARLTVTLKGGSYSLWCPLGNHASLGMKATVQARGGTPGTPTTPAPTTTTTGGGSDGGYGY